MGTSLKSPGAAASLAPAMVAPLRDGSITVRALADAYMRAYAGRDTTCPTRIAFWIEKLGDMPIGAVLDDHVQLALDALLTRRAKFYCGKDADGRPVFRALSKPPSGATANRYLAAFSSLCTWAQKKRMLPRDWVTPCKTVEKAPESKGRLRFLDDDERARLLAACRAQRWDRLYLLALMALTTGCRRGELERLRWCDIDFEGAIASIRETKNGDGCPSNGHRAELARKCSCASVVRSDAPGV
jgi:integrase